MAGRIAPNWSIHAGGQNSSGYVQFDYPAGVNESSGWYDFTYDLSRFYLGGSYILNPVRRLMVNRTQFALSAGFYATVMSTWIFAGMPVTLDDYEHSRYDYDLEDTFSEEMYLQADYDVFFLKVLSLGATMRYNHGNGILINDLKWMERGAAQPANIRPVKLDNYSLYIGLRAKFHLF